MTYDVAADRAVIARSGLRGEGAFTVAARTRWPLALDRIEKLEGLLRETLECDGDLDHIPGPEDDRLRDALRAAVGETP